MEKAIMTDFFAVIPSIAGLLPLGIKPSPEDPIASKASSRWWTAHFSLMALFFFAMMAVLLVVVAWSY